MSAVRKLFACLFVAALVAPSLWVLARAPRKLAREASREPEPRPYFYEPAISPDRKEIAFVSGGDIWTVPSEGGEARLLVSHPATESRPLYSPDGRRLAFISTRTGNGDIYVLDFNSGDLGA
jgi:tricorn protease